MMLNLHKNKTTPQIGYQQSCSNSRGIRYMIIFGYTRQLHLIGDASRCESVTFCFIHGNLRIEILQDCELLGNEEPFPSLYSPFAILSPDSDECVVYPHVRPMAN